MPEHASFVNAPILEDKALEKIQRNWLKKFKNKKNRISYSSKCHLEDDSQVVYGSDDEDMDDSEDDEDVDSQHMIRRLINTSALPALREHRAYST
jgi:hypothetical protein